MGYANAVSLDRLKAEVTRGGYDAVIHVGGKTGGGVGSGSLSWFYSHDRVGLYVIHKQKIVNCCNIDRVYSWRPWWILPFDTPGLHHVGYSRGPLSRPGKASWRKPMIFAKAWTFLLTFSLSIFLVKNLTVLQFSMLCASLDTSQFEFCLELSALFFSLFGFIHSETRPSNLARP